MNGTKKKEYYAVTFQTSMGWMKSWSESTAFTPGSPCRRADRWTDSFKVKTWDKEAEEIYRCRGCLCLMPASAPSSRGLDSQQ